MPQFPLETTIMLCCHNKTLLEIYYEKKKGGRGRYLVEPYEIKNVSLYAYDSNSGSIKRFLLPRIAVWGNTEQSWNVEEGHERGDWERKERINIGNVKLVKKNENTIKDK